MKDQDTQILEEAYESILKEASGQKCKRCGTGMKKHDDAEKAKKGYKNCPKCNLTFSPEATVKGSYAMMDKDGKIKTGVHKESVTIEEAYKTVMSDHLDRVEKTKQPISIFDFVEDWGNEGYGLALISPDDKVVDAYIDPSDYPDMILSSNQNGAKVIDGPQKGYYILFHSGPLENRIGKDWKIKESTEENEEILSEAIEELVDTPEGTLKFKVVKDREWGEWQVRILKLKGGRFVDLGDDVMYPTDDKEDAIKSMQSMAEQERRKQHAKEPHPLDVKRQPNPNMEDYMEGMK